MDPVTLGIATFGVQAIGSVLGFGAQKKKAEAENRARVKQYKQQLLMQKLRDRQRFQVYKNKKLVYGENLQALDTRFARMQMQDDLRMNELLKGAKLASQNQLVGQTKASGITARVASGVSAGKQKQSALAEIGRASAARQDQLMSSVYAKEMKDIANRESLYAAKKKEFNQVRFAPQESIPIPFGGFVDGPSPMSLIAGIGNAALSGVTAGLGQANFNQQLTSMKPAAVQPTISPIL